MRTNPFASLSLCQPLLRALEEEGYCEPTPIQLAAIPEVLTGRDLLATAQTGTGKTAAFALPMLQQLSERAANTSRKDRPLRALILTPTRELALQIDESFRRYGRHLGLRTAVVLGGVPQGTQVRALRQGPDILVATPGRLLDLMNQRLVRLDRVETLVLDEGDRMLDMGFIDDVRRIVAAIPGQRQTMLFSATLSSEIVQLAGDMLRDPARVEVTPAASVSGRIEQKVIFVEQQQKRELLAELLRGEEVGRVLVFTRTKRRANRLMKQLSGDGIAADAIHSNKSQNARQRALAAFDRGRIKVLVATDIVARGIDVEGISHVINFELPNDAESYVHRIGRTARAGAEGIALSLCNAEELPLLRGIERLTRTPLTVIDDHRFHSPAIAAQRQNGMAQEGARTGGGGRRRSGDGRRRSSGGGSTGGASSRRSSGSGRKGRKTGADKREAVQRLAAQGETSGEPRRAQFGRRTRMARAGR